MYVTQEQFDNLTCESLNSILDVVVKSATEQALKALPFVVGSVVQQGSKLKDIAAKFYASNPDLVQHKLMIAQMIQEEEQVSPGKPIEHILDDILPKVRRNILTLKANQ